MMSQPGTVKRIAKRGLQYAAATLGFRIRRIRTPQLLVLMYHRILPTHDPRSGLEEPGMIVTPQTFRLQLEIIRQYFKIIHLSEWLALKNKNRPLPPMACAITFDDGWADNHEFAFPILQELQVPATIFLVSNMVGTKQIFWPERLSRIASEISINYAHYWSDESLAWLHGASTGYEPNGIQPTQNTLSKLIAYAKRYNDQEIHERLDHIVNCLQMHEADHTPSLLDWQQIALMVESGLVEAGSHTCRHVRLNDSTSEDLLEKEVVDSKLKIEAEIGRPVDTFCFPNGDFSPLALEFVKQHYNGAVTTKRGWNTADSDSYLLQRIGIHQDISQDKNSFLARISGWM